MPESPLLVVTNTTPLISLALIGKLELLRTLYGEVVVPRAVYTEVLAGGLSHPGREAVRLADWLRVQELKDTSRAALVADLDRGEAEVIALAQEIGADLVIIDERMARQYAKRLGLILTGTLGVLLKAKHSGLIPSVGPLVAQLKQGGIHISESLLTTALTLAEED